jgi:hypothetical protein
MPEVVHFSHFLLQLPRARVDEGQKKFGLAGLNLPQGVLVRRQAGLVIHKLFRLMDQKCPRTDPPQ